jgi:carbon-monoxide dehydrogenase small subunit
MNKRSVSVSINGRAYQREVEARVTLGDFLRNEIGLTGTHLGCEHGVCGACTILLDGRSTRACLVFAVQADGRSITTIEGLAPGDGRLGILQEAFHKHHGLQCGFCTPGMLATLTELLADNPDATENDIRTAITGNLCRCTGYAGIVAAALDAAEQMRAQRRR